MGLSLVVGVAVVEALEEMGVGRRKLKWPNDLTINDKKLLAGILVELSGQFGGAAHIVIGLGLISMDPATSGIGQPWTSLKRGVMVKSQDQTI